MSTFGIDLLFETQRGVIQSKNDVLIAIIHWTLCKNDLKSVGIGDKNTFSDEDRPSELLPQGWNENQASYTLRYTHNNQIFVLYGNVAGNMLITNLLDCKTAKTFAATFKTDEVIKSLAGTVLEDYTNDGESIINQVKNEIINPVLKKETEAQAQSSSFVDHSNLLVHNPENEYGMPSRDFSRDALRDIGRRDLDPIGSFRGVGGGMIFQPDFRPRVDPRNPHAIPPGARFDPPNPLRRFNPDNDHFTPNFGYGNDY